MPSLLYWILKATDALFRTSFLRSPAKQSDRAPGAGERLSWPAALSFHGMKAVDEPDLVSVQIQHTVSGTALKRKLHVKWNKSRIPHGWVFQWNFIKTLNRLVYFTTGSLIFLCRKLFLWSAALISTTCEDQTPLCFYNVRTQAQITCIKCIRWLLSSWFHAVLVTADSACGKLYQNVNLTMQEKHLKDYLKLAQ